MSYIPNQPSPFIPSCYNSKPTYIESNDKMSLDHFLDIYEKSGMIMYSPPKVEIAPQKNNKLLLTL